MFSGVGEDGLLAEAKGVKPVTWSKDLTYPREQKFDYKSVGKLRVSIDYMDGAEMYQVCLTLNERPINGYGIKEEKVANRLYYILLKRIYDAGEDMFINPSI